MLLAVAQNKHRARVEVKEVYKVSYECDSNSPTDFDLEVTCKLLGQLILYTLTANTSHRRPNSSIV